MNSKLLISFILFFVSLNLLGQENDDSIRKAVLKSNVTDSLYVFGEWNEAGGTETHLRYLGVIKSLNDEYKIMTSSWFWGQSKRATSKILVFDLTNRYIGCYNVGMTYDLPEKIENSQIVFLHSKTNDCDNKNVTRLSFENGIPHEFFVECKDGYGDVYSFSMVKE
jgi:hypothetical protein